MRAKRCDSEGENRFVIIGMEFEMILATNHGEIAPVPAVGVGEDRAAVFAVVALGAENKRVVVPGKFQGGGHVLVSEGPMAVKIVEIVGAVLK